MHFNSLYFNAKLAVFRAYNEHKENEKGGLSGLGETTEQHPVSNSSQKQTSGEEYVCNSQYRPIIHQSTTNIFLSREKKRYIYMYICKYVSTRTQNVHIYTHTHINTLLCLWMQ